MNFMKRWTTSISSSYEWVMNQVENHDALVSAAIREMSQSRTKACVQLERVKRDGEAMVKRIAELKEVTQLWSERALKVQLEDREKALECLRRRKQAEREIVGLTKQVSDHSALEQQLSSDLKLIDERIAELKRKKNTMNARQYRAEALKAGQLCELGIIGEIDDIFERWEMKVGAYDVGSATNDTFEHSFSREEEVATLTAELEQLIAQTNQK